MCKENKTLISKDIFNRTPKTTCGCQEAKKTNENQQEMKTKITATVVDELNNPLALANILNLTTKEGVITNEKGVFELTAEANDVIQISFVGMKPKTTTANKISSLTRLQQDDALDEVVVTATKKINKHKGFFIVGALVALYVVAKKSRKKAVVVNG